MTIRKIENMIFGKATIELLVDSRRHFNWDGEFVETFNGFLAWYRFEIFHINAYRKGYEMDFCNHGGGGWYPADNVRNFKKINN